MDDAEQLREAFRSHEHLAPDPLTVAAVARTRGRGYRRRRRTAQVAGTAVVAAGVVVGVGVLAPTVSNGGSPAIMQLAAPPTRAPASAQAAPVATEDQQFVAFFGAGYDYDDAVELARLWGLSSGGGEPDPYAAKAEAGRRLLAGAAVPLAPGAGPASPVTGGQDEPGDAQRVAFLAAGYDWDDAVTLARLWGTDDVLQVKADAGQKLINGETLPIRP